MQRNMRAVITAILFLFSFSAVAQETEKIDEQEKESPYVFSLGEIVVTGKKEANIEKSGTTTVVTAEEIRSHDYKTLDQALEMIPGIRIETHTKGHKRINLRGFDQSRVMILVDGVPMNDVYSTDVDLSAIPIINVAKIIVNRGVSSALYGTDGAIGTINVITRKPDKLFAEASAEYGDFGDTSFNIAQGMPIGNFYYWLNGSVMTSNGFKPSEQLDKETRRKWFDNIVRYSLYTNPSTGLPYRFEEVRNPGKDEYINDTGFWDHSNYRKYFASGKAGYKFGKYIEAGVSAGFNYYQGMTNTYEPACFSDFNGTDWRSRRPDFTNIPINAKDYAIRNRAFIWEPIVQYNVSPYFYAEYKIFRLRLNAFFLNQYQKQDGYATTDHTIVKGESTLLKKTGILEPFYDMKDFMSYGFRLFPELRFASWHKLTMGVHWRNDTYKGYEQAISAEDSPQISAAMGTGRYPIEDYGSQTLSIGFEDELTLIKKIGITAGLSWDAQKFQTFKLRSNNDYGDSYIVKDKSMIWGTRDAFNPVFGAVYDPVESLLRLRAAFSYKTRFPTISEYSKVMSSEVDYDLKPEKSYNLNTGFEFMFLDKKIHIRSDYFFNSAFDRIAKVGKDQNAQVINIKEVTSHGIETILSGEAIDLSPQVVFNFSLSHTWLYMRSYDDTKQNSVNMGSLQQYVPEHFICFDARFDLWKQLAISLWGTTKVGARVYVMKTGVPPGALGTDYPYTTDYFTTMPLNNPLYLNMRIAQKIGEHLEVSFLFRNILDEYDIDPFNPGPGREFFASVSGNW